MIPLLLCLCITLCAFQAATSDPTTPEECSPFQAATSDPPEGCQPVPWQLTPMSELITGKPWDYKNASLISGVGGYGEIYRMFTGVFWDVPEYAMEITLSVPNNTVLTRYNSFTLADGEAWNMASIGIYQNQSGCYFIVEARWGESYWSLIMDQVPYGSVHRFGLMEVSSTITVFYIDGQSPGCYQHPAYNPNAIWNGAQALTCDTGNTIDASFMDLWILRTYPGQCARLTPSMLIGRKVSLLGADIFLYSSVEQPYWCFTTHTGCLHSGGAFNCKGGYEY